MVYPPSSCDLRWLLVSFGKAIAQVFKLGLGNLENPALNLNNTSSFLRREHAHGNYGESGHSP
jgi:hypothetical protein